MTTTRTITRDEAEQVLDQIAHEFPNEKNPNVSSGSCWYTHPTLGGHCVAAVGMRLLEIELPDVDTSNNSAGFGELTTTGGFFERLHVEWEQDAADLFSYAQSKADTGDTWGDAIKHALEFVTKGGE